MDAIREKYGLSERHACRIVGQHRGTQRYVPIVPADEDALTRAIVALASEYGRYGYRRVTALLQADGWQVGKDRVQRIWRREGLKVPHPGGLERADVVGAVWSDDRQTPVVRVIRGRDIDGPGLSRTNHSILTAAVGLQAAIPVSSFEGPLMAHSRTRGARTPAPKRTFDMCQPKVRMGWEADVFGSVTGAPGQVDWNRPGRIGSTPFP
ncbi:UNVERIFIED_ORG: hypothetical protein M2438_001167 [Methylobacterium sp. SuP10 SLI 274]|nr:hypothetical protein [Methylorubrum extorquens]MDF9790671.1 hypothetical protein [Methylorubrum extorquens]MDF9862377.1 hypothetical protein [Methylorubrum pseudosasae]MDH6635992.1 hypothetical protein [Methylobacterium sp. SuP10 SLI 274]MDH6665167.1 hypothetical protein [Methylorubrum zatmanii]